MSQIDPGASEFRPPATVGSRVAFTHLRQFAAADRSPRRLSTRRQAIGAAALNESWLLWGLLFGSIGLGFFIYGRKQRAVVPFVCGLVLMVFPYFVSNTLLLVGIGIALMVIPYFIRV